MKSLALICGFSCFALILVCSSQVEAQTLQNKPAPRKVSLSLPFLKLAPEAQTEILQQLARLGGRNAGSLTLRTATPPLNESLLASHLDEWFIQRSRGAGNERKLVARAVLEATLLARELSASPKEEWKIWGAELARRAAFLLSVRGQEPALAARILEAWTLPFVNDFPAMLPEDEREMRPTQQLVLQDACALYKASGNIERLFSVVNALIFVSESIGDQESADWARIKVAEELDKRGRYNEAISQLREVKTVALLGSQKWIPTLQSKATPKPKEQTP